MCFLRRARAGRIAAQRAYNCQFLQADEEAAIINCFDKLLWRMNWWKRARGRDAFAFAMIKLRRYAFGIAGKLSETDGA
jgi:hypothetical protein